MPSPSATAIEIERIVITREHSRSGIEVQIVDKSKTIVRITALAWNVRESKQVATSVETTIDTGTDEIPVVAKLFRELADRISPINKKPKPREV